MASVIFDFSGKTVVITGASTGIGKATAIAFAKAGANVAVCDVNVNDGNETVKSICDMGVKAIFCKVDVRKQADIDSAKAQILESFNTVDILINNAGVGPADGCLGPPLDNIPIEDFERLMDINFMGMVRMTKTFRDIFVAKKEGKIVNTAALGAYLPSPLMPQYICPKSAVITFSQAFSVEMGAYNVNVNVINPGFIYTPIYYERGMQLKNSRPGFDDCNTSEEVLNKMAQMSALKRMQTPEDIANSMLFLCSDAASEITGQVLNIDSGIARR